MNGVHRCLRLASLGLALVASAALIACGGGDESTSTGSAPAPGGTEAKKEMPTAAQISAEGKQCIDLVKAGRYSDAIAPCEQAMRDSAALANADVKTAYEDAKAKVAEEAQKAAVQAGADVLVGEDAGASAEKAASGMLQNRGEN